jgi:hypothetical protein
VRKVIEDRYCFTLSWLHLAIVRFAGSFPIGQDDKESEFDSQLVMLNEVKHLATGEHTAFSALVGV